MSTTTLKMEAVICAVFLHCTVSRVEQWRFAFVKRRLYGVDSAWGGVY